MVVTFCVADCPKECAKALDNRRLGKQRVEAMQIINLLESDKKKGFKHHPASLMWKDHINGLKYYCNCIIEEWISRGFKNTMDLYDISYLDDTSTNTNVKDNTPEKKDNTATNKKDNTEKKKDNTATNTTEKVTLPWWFTNKCLQMSHKCSLQRKDPKYYKFDVDSAYMLTGYIWPSKLSESDIKDISTCELKDGAKYCSELGSGVPPQYRLKIKDIKKWKKNKNVNPVTKRAISSTGTIYKDYEKAYKYYYRSAIDMYSTLFEKCVNVSGLSIKCKRFVKAFKSTSPLSS